MLYTVGYMTWVYQGLGDALRTEGITHMFSLMGDGNLELLADLAERVELPLIHARHEQGAVAMADGYARFTGRVGVATVTHGPGLSNTATSLLTAAAARSPLVLVAADTAAADVHHPQAFDQVAFGRASGARVQRLRAPATLGADVAEAFRHARQERGPVVLNAPVDVLRAPLPEAAAAYTPASLGRLAPPACWARGRARPCCATQIASWPSEQASTLGPPTAASRRMRSCCTSTSIPERSAATCRPPWRSSATPG